MENTNAQIQEAQWVTSKEMQTWTQRDKTAGYNSKEKIL